MNPEIYGEVKQLAADIVNASEVEGLRSEWVAYNSLKRLCEINENSDLNHPFQWETLGDFTDIDTDAITIYLKALALAETQKETEYIVSIKFELAKRYFEIKERITSQDFAFQANEVAQTLDDLELRKEISEFLLQFGE